MQCQVKGRKIEVETGVRHRAMYALIEGLKNTLQPGAGFDPADLFN